MAAAVSGLSPVIITVRMPAARSSPKRSRMPVFTMSLSSMTPSRRGPSATANGVAPDRAIRSATWSSSADGAPPCSVTQRRTASTAPLRICRPSKSRPDILVCALNGTNSCPSPSSRCRRPNRSLASTTMERPSGVSSDSEASWAALATSRSEWPSTGWNADAIRLPRVMVPVLSSSSVCTSPAASTARPDMARTFRWTSRSMPAMPMADSSAPIVVGIRQTSIATTITTETDAPANRPYGSRVTTTGTNTMVSAASRIVSAISFGVLRRLAPSTRVIIRSRNVFPGSAVIRATIRSDSTRVPPVTAERSPPASRITGADSPVIADSSTDATPSRISPSDGIRSPGSQTTRSPLTSSAAGIRSSAPGSSGRSRRACVSDRTRRSVSACAFPRPSAMASAKLANSTVRASQTVTDQSKMPGWASDSARVTTVPMSTTNITGLRTWTRGSSFLTESTVARPRPSGSGCLRRFCPRRTSEEPPVTELLDDRAEGYGGEERQRPDDQHHPGEQADEHRRVGAERAGRGGYGFLGGQGAGQREYRDHDGEPAQEQPEGVDDVVEGGVDADTREGRAVVVGHRGEVVEDLGETVRARVQRRDPARVDRYRDGGQDEHRDGHDQDPERGQLHLPGLYLLPQVLWCSPVHQPADEHGDDGEQQDGVQAAADAAGRDLAEHHPGEQREAAHGGIGILGRIDAAGRGLGGSGRVQGGRRVAEADLFAFHVAGRL